MFGVPEIGVKEVAQRRARGENFILLDVREPIELTFANLGADVETVPLSELAEQQLAALPASIATNKEAEVVVFCHHGSRSAQVAGWLRQQGWKNVYNMAGGINAYAIEVDSKIGRY